MEPQSRRTITWGRLVVLSASLLLATVLVGAVWWVLTSEERTGTYIVRGALSGIALDLGDADLELVGGGGAATVQVSHTERFAFGHPASANRAVSKGVLRLSSSCPPSLVGSCSARYRLRVPDNVPVTVRTSGGDVRSNGYRGTAVIDTRTGDVAVDAWCGFNLRVRAEAGDVHAATACPPENLDLRSGTGNVDALVPPGRYRVDAESDEGDDEVNGVVVAEDAPFMIQALSTGGDVSVGTTP
jgi:hypothetical protein